MSGVDETPIPQLLHRIHRGDQKAPRELIALLGDEKRFGGVLRRMARRMLSGHQTARQLVDSRDVVQETLVDVIDKLKDFHGESEGSLFAWLKTIIRTEVYRAARNTPKTRTTRWAIPPRPGEVDPLDELLGEELIGSVYAAVRRLPLPQRLVVELHLSGFNAAECGEMLGIEPATVRKREQRAVERLRERLRG